MVDVKVSVCPQEVMLKNPVVLGLLNKIAPNKMRDIKTLLPSFKGIVEALFLVIL